MLAQECAKWLAAQGYGVYGDGTEAEKVTNATIGVDQVPDASPVAIGVFTRPGAKADVKTDLKRPDLQIMVRGDKDPLTGFAVADAIQKALHGQHQFYFVEGGTKVYLVTCAGSQPAALGPGKNGRHEYSINLNMIV